MKSVKFKFYGIVFFALLTALTTYSQEKITNKQVKAMTPMELTDSRQFFDGLGKSYPADETVTITEDKSGTFLFTPAHADNSRIIIYLHGGGYIYGGMASHKAMVSHFASQLHTAILFVDYPLAPENPYPAAVNYLVDAYNHARKVYTGRKIILMGDSAGGGLIVSALGMMEGKDILKPDGVVMISPWTDLSSTNPSIGLNAKSDKIINRENLLKYALMYSGKKVGKVVNPSTLEFAAFPPNLIMVGDGEVLLDDSREFNKKVNSVQPDSKLVIYNGASHVWPLTAIQSENSVKAIKAIKEFIVRL